MKVQIIETVEADGNWYKVKKDDIVIACLRKDVDFRTNGEALKRANEIAHFVWENGGTEKIILEYETEVSE